MPNIKIYELTNYLGNVLTIISDRKIAVDNATFNSSGIFVDSTPDGLVDYYIADIVSATDYYAFGSPMPGRKYSSSTGYRYGFNEMEKDDEAKGGREFLYN